MVAKCNLCNNVDSDLLLTVNKRPNVEVDYKIPEEKYYREIHLCKHCGVVYNSHKGLISNEFYQGFYNSSITENRLQKRFDKIIKLPFSNSDNKNRALRILSFMYSQGYSTKSTSLLDIGSGTGVFPYEMHMLGYDVSFLDPDPAAVKHVNDNVPDSTGYLGKFEEVIFPKKYNLITFNKVLEHVLSPIDQLKKAKTLLSNNGIVYVELPDATPTLVETNFTERAEFNVEHYTVYTKEAMEFLANESKFNILKIGRLIDPSGKHTIYMFLNNKSVR